MLGFDFPTFVFQIVNFLVLLAILARFFYRPLMAAAARREAAVTEQREEAARGIREAAAMRAGMAAERTAAEAEAQAMLENARREAVLVKDQARGEGRAVAEHILEMAREASAREARTALDDVEQRLRETAVRLAEAIIEEAANCSLDEALFQRLLDRGDALQEELGRLPAPAATLSPVIVDVAAAPSPRSQGLLAEMVHRMLPASSGSRELEYAVQPDILAGCRIHSGNVVVDLSLRRMLSDLRKPPGGEDAP